MRTWREKLFHRFSKRISEETLSLIRKDRNGEGIQQSIVSEVVLSLVRMNVDHKGKGEDAPSIYGECFEAPFLEETRTYYAREAPEYIQTHGLWSYLEKALDRLEEERIRAARYLQPISLGAASTVVCEVLIADHQSRMNDEFAQLLAGEQEMHLHRLFLLLRSIDGGLVSVTRQFSDYIKSYGLGHLARLISEDSQAKETDDAFVVSYTESLLEIYLKFSKLVTNIFCDNSQFVVALEEAFRTVMNHNAVVTESPGTSAQLLAQYCDRVLRKSSATKLEEKELERCLEHCTQLFKFVSDRDVFHHHYSVSLANRLIEDSCREEEHEQFIIRGLQQVAGMEYTSKLQRMFQDMKVAESLSTKFKEFCEDEEVPPQSEFSPLILTSGTWPLSRQCVDFVIPTSLRVCVESFQQFYDKLHSGRCLTWLHNCSKGDIYAHLGDKTYQITMSTHMAAIILLFNDAERLSYLDIRAETNLPDSELRKILKSLVVSRLVLPDNKKLAETTKFKVNTRFNHKLLKFKLGGKLQTDKAKQSTSANISDGRNLLLQSITVRIMKMRKEISHNQLVQEILGQASAHFAPNVSQVKKVIETLIEKDFIERVNGENKYRYLA